MKKVKASKIFAVVMLLAAICVSMLSVFAAAEELNVASTEETVQGNTATDELDNVLYEENFNDVTTKVTIASGSNTTGASAGWILKQGSGSNGAAYIENGRLYFSGNKYDVLYRDGGEDWKNYILEADYCYLSDNVGWGGMLYNVQAPGTANQRYQKVGIGLDGTATLNGMGPSNVWSNNNTSINHYKMANDSRGLTVPAKDQPFRMKVVVYDNTATFYYAMLNTDGTMKTSYIKVFSISNIPDNNQQGSIGFMTSNGNKASCWIDNIKCQKLLYEENFDEITNKVNVAAGNTIYDAVEGWTYSKHNGGDGTAYVENGRLYMTGGSKAYDVLYRNNGAAWSNYTVEADFCYTSNNAASGWGGMMYNVQSATKFQKGAIALDGLATLNGYDGNWTNNNQPNSSEPTKNHYNISGKLDVPGLNTPFRMKISVYNETAAFYYAFLNDDGTMQTPFMHIMTIDNIPINAQSGTIGFMTSAWGNLGSFWIDNIRCYENVIVNYSENFDSFEGTHTIVPGNNTFGATAGWIYKPGSNSNGSAYVKDGRLYFSGNRYDVLYRDGGEVWGNYTLEADFCYTIETNSWGGMLYNVQAPGTENQRYQKAGIGLDGTATLNGMGPSNVWSNNNTSINHYKMSNNSELVIPGKDEPFRMKVTVYNKTATFYYAMLDTDGTMKTPFIKLMSISNILADNQTGSIGFMTAGNGSYASFWVDNIRCYSDTLVSYSESFDSYGNVEIAGNTTNTNIGVYFDRNGTSAEDSKAEIKDGALHLYGGTASYDALFFTMGKNWTNYVVESDFTYLDAAENGLNNDGWAGILFRSTDVNNFYKGLVEETDTGTSEAGKGALNGKLNGGWYENDLAATRGQYSGTVEIGTTYRLRIVVNEKQASLYMATYTDGVLGNWVRVITITDRFASEHMSGTIGLIVGGGNDSRFKSIKIDNLTVSQIPGADRIYEEPNAATIYEAATGIVNPPVVVQKLTATLPATEGERAAVVITEIDSNLNVLDSNGAVITTVNSFIDTYRKVLIPAFIVDNEVEADALANLIGQAELIDCYVMANESNAALVKRVRSANKITASITGAIIFDDLNSLSARQNARATVSDNMSYVAISKAPISEEAAFYFAARQIAAWSFAESEAEVYRGIANGYHGIVSSDVSRIYDVYESITETTVSGETVVIAHRGANTGAVPQYPENTLLGIRAAKEIWGADGIEIDFGLTKDNYVVLMHDDTLDRTTNAETVHGKTNIKVSDLTLEQIKALAVDYVAGKETIVPTLDEVLLLAKELDLVLYCHVKDVADANIAAFTYLVEKHGCEDNVLLFAGAMSSYNANTDRVYTGTAYNLNNSPVVPNGIVYTAETLSILSECQTYLEGVVRIKNALNKYNYQPLFYPYLNQGDMWRAETFYYQLSARGLVNTHSITDGQSKMDKLALTESGAVGWLTNNPQLCDDYHYAIDLSEEKLTLKLGEAINTEKALKLIKGTANANCGLIQIDGNALVSTDAGYTLNEAGTVTVVYYATRTADGGSTYRIYSEPVELTFVAESKPENLDFTLKTSITLSHALIYNVYIPVCDELNSFTLDGTKYADMSIIVDKIRVIGEKEYYLFAIELPSAEAAKDVVLEAEVTVGEKDYTGRWTMSIPKYARKVLETSTSNVEKMLVKDVLAYVQAAYNYFDGYNTEAEIERVNTIVDEILAIDGDYEGTPTISGDSAQDKDGIVTGVTLNLDYKPTIRFYVTSTDIEFYANGSKLNTVKGIDEDERAYVELDVYAYVLAQTIVFGDSGSYHISDFLTNSAGEDHENLVACFVKYVESAAAYRNSVSAAD